MGKNINFNGSNNDKFIFHDIVSKIAARMEKYKLNFSIITGNIVIIFVLCTLEHVSQLIMPLVNMRVAAKHFQMNRRIGGLIPL